MSTLAVSYAQELVAELEDEKFVDSVSLGENRHGVFIDVTVPDRTAESWMYEYAESEPVWFEITVR